MNIGIFGGTFNPVHFGHLRIAEEARQAADLGRIIFIPSGNPPLKTDDIAAAPHRLAMTRLAIQGNPFFEVLNIECRSRHKSYTVHTMQKLREIYPKDRLFFMLGIDAFLDIPNWYQPDLLVRHTDFLILSRPGCRFADLFASPYLSIKKNILQRLDARVLALHTVPFEDNTSVTLLNVTPFTIAATDIRNLAAQGKSIKYLLPAEIESYIIFENLYGFGNKRHRAVTRGCR